MSNLLGVVLCGGQSKRMGTDKGLLVTTDTPWAVLIANKLKTIGLPVILSVNATQQEAYQQLFPDTRLIPDKEAIQGPLNGLLSVHENYPDKDLLLMACDLIDMDNTTLQNLVHEYHQYPGYEYYVYSQDEFTQPFCAIYTAMGLATVYAQYQAEELKKYSLHNRFEEGNTRYIPLNNKEAFNNYNNL